MQEREPTGAGAGRRRNWLETARTGRRRNWLELAGAVTIYGAGGSRSSRKPELAGGITGREPELAGG
eukprot:10123740-Alexandrium_andersonii.AAC.1